MLSSLPASPLCLDVERAQSAYFPDMRPALDVGGYGGEHVCVVSATPKAPKHMQCELAMQGRSYSAGCFAAPNGGAAARRACLEQSDAAPAPARRKLLAYTSIHQFSQLVEVYRGSVSTVYKAMEDATGQRVVIKAYHKARMQAKHHHKLHREVDIAARMNGDYVAQMFATIEDDDNVYIIMELCEGGDLFKSMMLHGGKLDETYVCLEIIAPLLRVLEKMHKLQLMHRDIKPENIFLTRGGQLRLGDFGLAINFAQEVPFSRSGTLDYMAPEVLKNPASQMQEGPGVTAQHLAAKSIKPYTTQVDVWAVGILAYELVCGKPPFEVEDEAKTASLIMYCNQIKFPSAHSGSWADFVTRALVKDPEERADAATLLQHPWIQHNLHRSRKSSGGGAPGEHEKLFSPLPLDPPRHLSSAATHVTPMLSYNHSDGQLLATAAAHLGLGGGQYAGQYKMERSESVPLSPPTPTAAHHVSMFSKESLTLSRTPSASSSIAGAFSSSSFTNSFGGSAVDAGGVSVPQQMSAASRTAAAAGASSSSLPPRASPLSKTSVSLAGRPPAAAPGYQAPPPLQSHSDPGRLAASDPLHRQYHEQYMQQYAQQQQALAASALRRPAPSPLTPGAASAVVPGRTPPPAVLLGSSSLYGDSNMCDSPHAGAGTKERLKFYLQSQKLGRGL